MYSTFSRQPITSAELLHQNRSIPPRRWRHWIGVGATGVAYGLAVVIILYEPLAEMVFHASSTPLSIYQVDDFVRPLIIVSVATATLLHFRRMFQTLSLSANSIAREKQANNWDMLVLTGIDARQIVRGKWWATVRHMWRPYVMLGLLRALLIIGYGISMSRSYLYYSATMNMPVWIPTMLQILLAGLAIFVLTLANLPFTAACGVTAFNRRGGVALARAAATRLTILIVTGIVVGLIYHWWSLDVYRNYSGYGNSYNLIGPMVSAYVLTTLFDNGVIMSGQVAMFGGYYGISYYGDGLNPTFAVFLPATLISLAIYGLLTVAMLRFAQWQAVNQSALPPPKRRSPKSARIF